MENITEINSSLIWDDEYKTADEMIAYLNGEANFGSFFHTVKKLMIQKGLIEENADYKTVRSKLSQLLKQNLPDGNFRNVRNWLAGSHEPDNAFGEFAVCFALGLTYGECLEFFRKGCGKAGFNVHDPVEVLAAYCITNGHKLQEFISMKNRLDRMPLDDEEYDQNTLDAQDALEKVIQPGRISAAELFRDYLHPIALEYRQKSQTRVDYYRDYRMSIAKTIVYGQHDDRFVRHFPAAYRSVFDEWTEADKEKLQMYQDRLKKVQFSQIYSDLMKETVNGEPLRNKEYEFLIRLITPQVLFRILLDETYSTETSSFSNLGESKLSKRFLSCFPTDKKLGKIDKADHLSITHTEFRKGFILLYYVDTILNLKEENGNGLDFEEWYDELNHDLLSMQEMPLYAGNPFDFLMMYSIRRTLDKANGIKYMPLNREMENAYSDFVTEVYARSYAEGSDMDDSNG